MDRTVIGRRLAYQQWRSIAPVDKITPVARQDTGMPVHDWTRVDSGIFHAFHHDWITEMSRALNHGVLPAGYYALPEQIAGELGPDVLALHAPGSSGADPQDGIDASGGIALAEAPPKVRLRLRSLSNQYAAKAKSVVIRHVSRHQIISMIEVVSPGNKNNQNGINAFVHKAREALAAGIHLLVIDLFPPGPRDPQGIHAAIWAEDCGEGYALPAEKPLTCVGYLAGAGAEAFVEFAAVGDELPSMPLFITPETYIQVPLASTYAAAWDALPDFWRNVLTIRP